MGVTALTINGDAPVYTRVQLGHSSWCWVPVTSDYTNNNKDIFKNHRGVDFILDFYANM